MENYYNKSEVDSLLEALRTSLNEKIDNSITMGTEDSSVPDSLHIKVIDVD